MLLVLLVVTHFTSLHHKKALQTQLQVAIVITQLSYTGGSTSTRWCHSCYWSYLHQLSQHKSAINPIEIPWFLLVKPSVSFGFSLVFLWFSCGFPMVFPWFSYGVPMVFLWFSHDFPMVFLWFSYGFPMVVPLFSHGFPTYGFPIVFPWFSYGFPTKSPPFQPLPVSCRAAAAPSPPSAARLHLPAQSVPARTRCQRRHVSRAGPTWGPWREVRPKSWDWADFDGKSWEILGRGFSGGVVWGWCGKFVNEKKGPWFNTSIGPA